jgi:hypothetical protein
MKIILYAESSRRSNFTMQSTRFSFRSSDVSNVDTLYFEFLMSYFLLLTAS